jgi:DNA-binding CsgD family transcriptional regulator
MASGGPMLERDAELQRLDVTLASARDGRGSATLVQGQAGTGKSRVLAEAAARAADAGMLVLWAGGEAAEGEFAFGVALQLLEEQVRPALDEHPELLSGPARLARPLLEHGPDGDGRPDADGFFPVVHGLYWVVHALAERRPVLAIVDDVQWADVPSLRFLAYLSHRIAGLPVALVAARRLGEELPAAARLEASPDVEVLALGPLSAGAAAQLVRHRVPDAGERFCAACAEVTAGNPFYLEELLRTVRAEGMDTSDAGAAEVRLLAPETVARSVLLRLSRLPLEAEALARAIAVLGAAPLSAAAELAAVDPEPAVPMAAALVDAGVLEDREQLRFTHAIVRSAVNADATEAERGRMERRAASLLQASGAPPERVAAHLLAAPPAGEAWAIEPLRVAAAHALATGAADSASRYLRRALAEPPPPRELAGVLTELGRAAAVAAQPDAAEHLRAALPLLPEPLARARVQLLLGRALSAQGRLVEAGEAFESGAADALGRDPNLVAEMESGYIGVARLDPTLYPQATERIERLVAQPPAHDAPGQRALLAEVALARAWAGAPAEDVLPLARRAWAQGALLAEQGPDAHAVYILTGALVSIDELDFELEVLGAALAEARRRGSVMAVATASYCRSIPLYLQGRISESLADSQQAIAAEGDGWELFLPVARAYSAAALLERRDPTAAEAALDLRDRDRWAQSISYAPYLDVRARLRLVQRRPAEALADALDGGRLLEEMFGGTLARGFVQWRLTAALAALAMGDRDRARELCEAELELARASRRPREIGAMLRVAAMLEDGGARVALLRESVATLEASQSVLELLRALVDLGAALRRAGQRQDARAFLERALDTASSRGATALAVQAREELLATGARPRRTALRGVDSLTPSELRVGRLAGEGLRNREIAEALFVTVKTVDYHLRHVYQKLGASREQLGELLAAKP